MSLRYRIAAAVTALAALVLFIVLASTLRFAVRATERALGRSRETTMVALAQLARRPFLTGEYGEMQPYVEGMAERPHVKAVRVLDETGRAIASSDSSEIGASGLDFSDGSECVWSRSEVSNVAGPLGSVAICFSNAAIAEAYTSARNVGIATAVTGLLAIAFASLLMGFLLTRRLRRTAEAALRLAEGDFSTRVGERGRDEVADVGSAIDTMAARIATQVEALQRGEERYRTLLDHMADLVQVTSPSGEIVLTNRAWRVALGREDDPEPRDLRFSDLLRPEDRDAVERTVARVTETGATLRQRLMLSCGEDREVVVEASFSRLRHDGDTPGVLAVMRDVTESVRLAEEIERKDEMLRQAQRLESLGRLAGGVAHDFNNILTVISSEAEEQLATASGDPRLRSSALEIKRAVQRAAALTRQLLAFGRRHKSEPELLELNAVVRDLETMLRRLIGADLTLSVRLGETAGNVRVDSVQLQQVIVNLVVNARDAMPHGGAITIETNAQFRPDEEGGDETRRYAALVVIDTGIGMDESTREQAFDPFFTTKGIGKGTGLGLSMVYGIVRQAGGLVEVHSEPREGSVFTVLLPSIDEELSEQEEPEAPSAGGGRGETILVVEDEDGVRAAVAASLSRDGYRVIEASTPAEALARPAGERIDLVVSDVVMPGHSGPELGRRLREDRPGLPLLFISGYAAGAGEIADAAILAKPFSRRELLARVRETLDRSRPKV